MNPGVQTVVGRDGGPPHEAMPGNGRAPHWLVVMRARGATVHRADCNGGVAHRICPGTGPGDADFACVLRALRPPGPIVVVGTDAAAIARFLLRLKQQAPAAAEAVVCTVVAPPELGAESALAQGWSCFTRGGGR